MKTVRSIRFPDEIEQAIERLAKEQDRTFSGQVISLVRSALSRPYAEDEQPGR
jgi:hypothetical protein